MAEVNTGLRAILSHAIVYDTFRSLLGAGNLDSTLISDYIKPYAGQRIIDIGCGPATILAVLEGTDYVGLDLNPDYIAAAEQQYGEKGKFYNVGVEQISTVSDQKFDLALAIGVLHHLDDETVEGLFRETAGLLRPSGKMVTIDPVYSANQSKAARWLIDRDRGQNVRSVPGYEDLAGLSFQSVFAEARTDLLRIPYTHCIMSLEQPIVG